MGMRCRRRRCRIGGAVGSPGLGVGCVRSMGGLSACGCAALADAVVAEVCAAFALPVSWPILVTSLAPCAMAAALNEVFGVPWSTAAIRPALVLASVAVEIGRPGRGIGQRRRGVGIDLGACGLGALVARRRGIGLGAGDLRRDGCAGGDAGGGNRQRRGGGAGGLVRGRVGIDRHGHHECIRIG